MGSALFLVSYHLLVFLAQSRPLSPPRSCRMVLRSRNGPDLRSVAQTAQGWTREQTAGTWGCSYTYGASGKGALVGGCHSGLMGHATSCLVTQSFQCCLKQVLPPMWTSFCARSVGHLWGGRAAGAERTRGGPCGVRDAPLVDLVSASLLGALLCEHCGRPPSLGVLGLPVHQGFSSDPAAQTSVLFSFYFIFWSYFE